MPTTKSTAKKSTKRKRAVKRNHGLDLKNVVYEKKRRVAYVTINRPETRNALNTQTREELAMAIEDAWVDDKIGASHASRCSMNTSSAVPSGLASSASSC